MSIAKRPRFDSNSRGKRALFLLDWRFHNGAPNYLPDWARAATLRTMPARQVFFAVVTIAAAILASAHARETTAETIRVIGRQTLTSAQIYARGAPPGTATHELRVTLAYFADGGWEHHVVLKASYHAAGILAQCGVVVTQIEIAQIMAPQRYRYFAMPASRELAHTLQLPKPTVYFVIDTRQQPAFDAEAIGRSNGKTRPELVDTVWITRATRDPGIALAHELSHVLMDSGEHVAEPDNLMREDTAPENTRLNPAQCARLRAAGTRNGLLLRPVKN